jgi:tetratricopeptide (TPR) repeat protein
MSMVDGRFRNSSRLLREDCESLESDPINWGDMVRVRGHAHRFSFALEDAERLYLEAMRVTDDGQAPALLGRLQTNLTETYCWYDPERALDAADAAADANSRLNNQTELAKNDAAKAIALAKLGRFDLARGSIAQAIRHAEEVGYRAGVAFALQATIVTEALAGEEDRMHTATAELEAVIVEIDTYFHLMAVPHLLCDNRDGFAAVVAAHEWIDEDYFESRLSALLIT